MTIRPMGSPFHIGALVGLGLWLVDNMNLEDIAKACAERSRWEFLLTPAPLRLRNVTGSPLNPIERVDTGTRSVRKLGRP